MIKKKIKLIQQMGVTDCGLACLSMLFNYYGYKIDLPTLSSEVIIGRDGLTVLDMIAIAKGRGFELKAYSCMLENSNVYKDIPFILCTNENHYVVAGGIKEEKVKIFDPDFGIYYFTVKEIAKNYKCLVLIISPLRKKYSPNIKKTNLKIHIATKNIFKFLLYTIIIEGLVLLSPSLINYIVDSIGENSVVHKQELAILLLVAGATYFLISRLRKKAIVTTQSSVFEEIYNTLIRKIFKLDMDFFYGHTYGDIINRINNLNIVNNVIASSIFAIVIDIVTAVVCFVVIAKISMEIALSIGTLTILLTGGIFAVGVVLRRENNIFMMIQSQMQGMLFNNISNIEQVRSLGIENIIEKKIINNNKRYISQYKKKEACNVLLESITATISWILLPAIYLGGSFLLETEKISLGELISIVTVATLFIKPFITISLYYPQFNMCMEIFSRVKEIMLARNKKDEGKMNIAVFEKLELKKINFSYANCKIKALTDINISIRKGTKVAIVGSSGSGKSTIAKIIVNLYSTYDGQVLINEISNAAIYDKSLCKMFSIVTQTPLIFNGTIRENIDVVGDFDDVHIYKILKIAALYDEVEKFPLKLNTTVGENGQNISGGQKQRIAIARALLYLPSVLIFDEGTSNLDPVTEHIIYDNIKELQITQIIITHRLNTIIDSDYIYVVEGGRILEEGNHDTLIQLNGYYTKAFQLYC